MSGAARGTGRPPAYTDEIGEEICQRLMDGQSLKAICEDPHMPARSSVMKWLAEDTFPVFSDSYARARKVQADTDADDIGDIARKAARGEIDPGAARAAIDGLKWTAGKRKPQVYGDRIAHVGGGEDEAPIQVQNVTNRDRAKAVAALIAKAKRT